MSALKLWAMSFIPFVFPFAPDIDKSSWIFFWMDDWVILWNETKERWELDDDRKCYILENINVDINRT